MPTTDPDYTRVVFRKWRDTGDIIALFPDQEENDGLIGSYMHIGQHGAASPGIVYKLTEPARPGEYAPLYRELTQSVGYKLIVYARITRRRERGNDRLR